MAADRPPIPVIALSIEEACASLGCSWKFFHEHVSPSLPIVRLGSKRLVPVQALEAWLLENASLAVDPDAGRPR